VEAEPPEECDVVKPGHAVDLRLAADAVDDDLETLKTLNPQLLRTVTPPDPDFELRLPRGTGEDLVAGLAQIPTDKWVMWRQHRVAEGDTLGAIGRRYGVTPSAILQANNLDSGAPLSIGQTLTIPANHAAQTGLGQLVRYRVRRGDTLTLVARQFDVTPADIERWNGPRSATLSPGMTLKIYPGGRPNPTPAPAGQKALKTHKLAAEKTNVTTGDQGTVTHSVRPGETLWSIARAYRTTVEALRAANPFLAGHALHVGDQLRILTPR
jgi:LysM repeat protein